MISVENEKEIDLDNTLLVLFDGVCNLCNSSVSFIIDRNSKNNILFSSLQSETGQYFLDKYNLPKEEFKSLILIKNNKVYTKSSGALIISKELDGIWKFSYMFLIIPKFLRDFVYSLIANNRYKIFGKSDTCRIPSKEEKARFI